MDHAEDQDERSRPTSAPPPTGYRHALLVVHSPTGDALGQRLEVNGAVVLGRHEGGPTDAHEDRTLSRAHARLVADENGLVVHDLGSANGTFVNGERLGPSGAALGPGDVLELGELALLVDPSAAPPNADAHPGVIARAAASLAHLHALERAAASQQHIFVHGPAGTGKTTAALELHHASQRQRRGAPVFAYCDRPGELAGLLAELVAVDGRFNDASTLVLESLDLATADELQRLPAVCGLSRERGVRVVMCSRTSPMDLVTEHEGLSRVVAGAFPLEVPRLEARREDIPWLVRAFFAPFGDSAPDLPRAFVAELMRGAPASVDPGSSEQSLLARAMGRAEFPGELRGLYTQLDAGVGLVAVGQELLDSRRAAADEAESMPPRRAVLVARDGTFVQAGRERAHLRGRRPLRVTLERLVACAESTPWASVPVQELFDLGWSTPSPDPLAAASRVYLALATLRRVGLAGHVERTATGYRLMLSRELRVVDGGASEPPTAG